MRKNAIALYFALLLLTVFFAGCTSSQQTATSTIIPQTPMPTPIPAPIVGTWQGTISFSAGSASTYQITFHPYHQFDAKPLTSDGFPFSGTWNQCFTDVECLPSEVMFQTGKKYTTDNYKIKVTLRMLGQPITLDDIVTLKDATLDYRGTQHKI
jgi:hypothetical protein